MPFRPQRHPMQAAGGWPRVLRTPARCPVYPAIRHSGQGDKPNTAAGRAPSACAVRLSRCCARSRHPRPLPGGSREGGAGPCRFTAADDMPSRPQRGEVSTIASQIRSARRRPISGMASLREPAPSLPVLTTISSSVSGVLPGDMPTATRMAQITRSELPREERLPAS